MNIDSNFIYYCQKKLHETTQKKFKYYHEIQLIFFTGLTFVGTSCISIYSERAIIFSAVFYGSGHLFQEQIKQIPWDKENKILFRIEQITLLSLTMLMSKVILYLLRESLTFYQCFKVTGMFIVAYYVFLVAYRHFSNYFNPFKKDSVYS